MKNYKYYILFILEGQGFGSCEYVSSKKELSAADLKNIRRQVMSNFNSKNAVVTFFKRLRKDNND